MTGTFVTITRSSTPSFEFVGIIAVLSCTAGPQLVGPSSPFDRFRSKAETGGTGGVGPVSGEFKFSDKIATDRSLHELLDS
jgi:hypothetical protein